MFFSLIKYYILLQLLCLWLWWTVDLYSFLVEIRWNWATCTNSSAQWFALIAKCAKTCYCSRNGDLRPTPFAWFLLHNQEPAQWFLLTLVGGVRAGVGWETVFIITLEHCRMKRLKRLKIVYVVEKCLTHQDWKASLVRLVLVKLFTSESDVKGPIDLRALQFRLFMWCGASNSLPDLLWRDFELSWLWVGVCLGLPVLLHMALFM